MRPASPAGSIGAAHRCAAWTLVGVGCAIALLLPWLLPPRDAWAARRHFARSPARQPHREKSNYGARIPARPPRRARGKFGGAHPNRTGLAVDLCGAAPDAERCAADVLATAAACATRRQPRLGECANLSPPGTGTMALYHALRLSGAKRAAHDHQRAAVDVPDAPCLLMTLREPAARMESGYRFVYLKAPRKPAPTLDEMLAAWRANLTEGRRWAPPAGYMANFFWPQAGYLKGLTAQGCRKGRVALHVLCTETLGADWARLSPTPLPADNIRDSAYAALKRGVVERSRITKNSTRAWANEELFPTDYRLWRRFCGMRNLTS